jgi:hypothetical protein
LPSARLEALGKEGIMADNGCDRRFSLPNAALALGKGFVERKTLGKRAFAECFFAGSPLPSVGLGKAFAKRKLAFAETSVSGARQTRGLQ